MAIKVGGTTVVDDSRGLTNIATVDATTAAAISAAGVGGGGEHDFVASGAIANGDVVVLNSDGTVSVITTNTVTSSLGTEVVYESETSFRHTPIYDSANQKVIIFFVDSQGGNNYGAAIVGTVSGTSITFGSQTFFQSTNVGYITASYDTNAQKALVVWENTSGSGSYSRAAVGTVSGTSISFGSTNDWSSNRPQWLTSTFDSSNNSVFVAYYDSTNGVSKVNVATISGTSVSFGASTTFASVQTRDLSCDFDSSSGKVVLSYNETTAGTMSAVVATISGTSVSFGTATQIIAAQTSTGATTYDTQANKTIISYRDTLDSNKGKVVIGSVSGTSISFSSAFQFDSGSVSLIRSAFNNTSGKINIVYISSGNGKVITGKVSDNSITFDTAETYNVGSSWGGLAYDANSGNTVIGYMDTGNSNYGTAIVYQNGYVSYTPSADGYIGVAAEAISDTATGAVTIDGGVNEGQTGLTIGTTYYVADDGSLTTTNNGRKIGKAISATKVLVDSAMSGDEMNAYLGSLV